VSNQVFDLAAWISPKNKVMRATVKVRAFEFIVLKLWTSATPGQPSVAEKSYKNHDGYRHAQKQKQD
jgi:hypothetical protein